MERGQVIIIAVVVAALALFGLKVWSDRATESDLTSASQVAAERLARAGGVRGESPGGDSASDGRSGRNGSSLRPGSGGIAGGRIGDSGGASGRGGPDVTRGGGARAGGGVGSAAGGGRETGGVGVVGGGTLGGPKVQQKDSLVEFLGSQPPTTSDLASPEAGEGDVALKLEKPDDIDPQGGEGRNVEEAEDGDGIKITDETAIQFPNNVNPDSATFSFTLKPDWAGSDQSDNALLQLRGQHEWNNRIELVKNGEFLRFILTDNTGREADISVRISDWAAGQEHEIEASYGDGRTQLMVDNRVVGTNSYTGQLMFQQGIPLQVGGDWQGSNYQAANATFRNFTITNSAAQGG